MIPALSKALPDHAIVVRPHPIERLSSWEEIARGCKRVHVINEGNVVPWLMAADALVHNTCTTSIEASVLGTPSVSYEPIPGDFGADLPNSLSHRTFDLDALKQKVRAIVGGELGVLDEGARAHLHQHVTSLDGSFASDRMIDALEEAGYLASRPSKPSVLRHLRGVAHAGLRTGVKRINSRRDEHRNSSGYHDHRFPPILAAELNARIERFSKLLGRFEEIRVRPISEHIFGVDR